MKVLKKQTNSKMCIICGMDNELGVKAPFYEMEDNSVVSVFKYKEVHQSYPGRVHGGMITSMLDEIAARAIWITHPDIWGVTINLNIKYRRPVPYDETLYAIGKIIDDKSRTFKGVGVIENEQGEILAEVEAAYMKLPLDKISDVSHDEINVYVPDTITEINHIFKISNFYKN